LEGDRLPDSLSFYSRPVDYPGSLAHDADEDIFDLITDSKSLGLLGTSVSISSRARSSP